MKSSVAVALILAGALLIMLPPLFDYLHQRNLVELADKSGSRSVMLDGKMSELYSFGCWTAGCLMILPPALAAVRERRGGAQGE